MVVSLPRDAPRPRWGGEGMMARKRELSGQQVKTARIWQDERGRWHFEVITDMTETRSPGFDTSLAAARTLVNELQKHSTEF